MTESYPPPAYPPPTGYPQFGGYPPAGAPTGPPAAKPLSAAAVAALVLSIVCLLIPAVICAVVGLVATRKDGKRRGRGFAVASLVVTVVWIGALVAVAVWAAGRHADRNPDGQVTQAGNDSVFTLQVGDCLPSADTLQGEITQVDVLPCSASHGAEVLASVTLTGTTWDEADVVSQSESGCVDAIDALLPDRPYDIYYLHPTQQSWENADDRTTLCVVGFTTPRTGSVHP